MKTLIITAMVIGSYGGSLLPLLWGGSTLSVISIFSGALGGFFGIWAGYKLAHQIGL